MAVYAIGDIQGCYTPFRRLLDALKFDPTHDQLWLAGDLINRGPDSLKTIRFIQSLGDSIKAVLGNHECHYLAVAYGYNQAHRSDTFQPLIDAPDATELRDWVRQLPFFYQDNALNYAMIHAGLPPEWSIEQTRDNARTLEAVFAGEQIEHFLSEMYGNLPNVWSDTLQGNDRLRYIINAFTRLRFLTTDGTLDFKEKGAPDVAPKHLIPWFAFPHRKTQSERIIFGHWSTLGFHQQNNTTCLDSGCLWGGELTAMRLDSAQPSFINVTNSDGITPHQPR